MSTRQIAQTIAGRGVLPDNWRWVPLGNLARFLNGAAFKPTDWGSEGTPIIRIQNLNDRERPMNRTTRVIDQELRVRAGDILVSWSATLDAFIWSGEEAWLNQHIFRVIPGSEIAEPRFLFHLLKNEIELLKKSEHLHGSTMMHINRGPFLAHSVPLPPPRAQQQIAKRVDELLSDIDDGEAALARARADLEVYRRALLKAAVTGELTADWRAANPPQETGAQLLARILTTRRTRWHADPRNSGKLYRDAPASASNESRTLPDGWTWARLPQLGDFGRGKSKHRPRDDARLYGGPFPFVQTGIISASEGKIVRYDQTYSEMGRSQSKLWPRKTLCITIAANIAKSGVLAFDACFPDSVVGLSCAAGVVPEYIHLIVSGLQAVLERNAPATAQKNINLDVLEEVAIPLPSSAEQLRIVQVVEESLLAADVLVKNEFDIEFRRLRQSILSAAFRGELV